MSSTRYISYLHKTSLHMVEPHIYTFLEIDEKWCKLWESVNCRTCKHQKLSVNILQHNGSKNLKYHDASQDHISKTVKTFACNKQQIIRCLAHWFIYFFQWYGLWLFTARVCNDSKGCFTKGIQVHMCFSISCGILSFTSKEIIFASFLLPSCLTKNANLN